MSVYVRKHTYTQPPTHTPTHTHTDKGGYPKEEAGHQNYKVGEYKSHDATTNEEQLNSRVYVHTDTHTHTHTYTHRHPCIL